jgi:hypothetical protein
METMRLVVRHVIRKGSQNWKEIDDLAFRSKNLYNQANYEIRQHFFQTNQLLIRKVVPNTFGNGIEGVVVHPVKITLTN